MNTKKVEVRSVMKRLFGLTNNQSSSVPEVKIKYFVGITTTKSDTESLEKRKESQHEAYLKLAAEYGFSKISSVSAEVSYKGTFSDSTTTASSTMTSAQMTSNIELEFNLGEIPPGKGKYLYQPILLDENVLMDFSDLIVQGKRIKNKG